MLKKKSFLYAALIVAGLLTLPVFAQTDGIKADAFARAVAGKGNALERLMSAKTRAGKASLLAKCGGITGKRLDDCIEAWNDEYTAWFEGCMASTTDEKTCHNQAVNAANLLMGQIGCPPIIEFTSRKEVLERISQRQQAKSYDFCDDVYNDTYWPAYLDCMDGNGDHDTCHAYAQNWANSELERHGCPPIITEAQQANAPPAHGNINRLAAVAAASKFTL